MAARFPRRGDIYFADFDPVFGSEQGGQRPVVIIQNDINNQFSPVTIVASLTTAAPKGWYPTDVTLRPGLNGARLSRIQLNQLRTLDKRRLGRLIGQLTDEQLAQVDEALKISLGLVPL